MKKLSKERDTESLHMTTLDYYNENARSFTEGTVNVDFTTTQHRFLDKLAPKSHILDFGCGSGRGFCIIS